MSAAAAHTVTQQSPYSTHWQAFSYVMLRQLSNVSNAFLKLPFITNIKFA